VVVPLPGVSTLQLIGIAGTDISALAGDGLGNIYAAAGSTLYLALATSPGTLPQLLPQWTSSVGAFTNLAADSMGYMYATAGSKIYRVSAGCVYNIANGALTATACASPVASALGPAIGQTPGAISSLFETAGLVGGAANLPVAGSAVLLPYGGGNIDEVFVSSGTSVYGLRYSTSAQYSSGGPVAPTFGIYGSVLGTTPISVIQSSWFATAGSAVYSIIPGYLPGQTKAPGVVYYGELPSAD